MPIDIEDFRRREREESARSLREMKERHSRLEARIREGLKTLAKGCRPVASSREYGYLVREWIKDGGVPMHSYDYPFERYGKDFWVAERDFVLPCLEGAASVIVFVPDGIKYTTPEGIGHNILVLEGGQSVGIGYGPPIFSDT